MAGDQPRHAPRHARHLHRRPRTKWRWPVIAPRRTIEIVATCLGVVVAMSSHSRAADDVLARSRAMYAGLRSYADTGTVLHEFSVSSKERHTFTTYFNRSPRRFYFDFKKE